jgi:hypothetical protein
MDDKAILAEAFRPIKTIFAVAEVFLFVVAIYGLYQYWTRDPRLASLPPPTFGGGPSSIKPSIKCKTTLSR